MTGRLQDKVALIVGAARGIGKGIAERFAEEGAHVVIADLEVEAGEAIADALRGFFVRCDISKMEDAQLAVEVATRNYGHLDILVQNAGIYPWQLIENTSPDDWDRVMAVNLRGCFIAARAALEPMKARGAGRMLFTSSITGPHVTSPGHGHYSATKAGINGFIRAAALEFSAYGITVNGVEPGNILTETVQQQRSAAFLKSMQDAIPLGRLGSARDVANAFLFLASDEASYITGTTIVVDGGQLLPEGNDFRIVPPVSLDLGDGFLLRQASAADHAALSMVCLKTGDGGKDATAREDDSELLGLIYAIPYQLLEPDFAFAVEGPHGVCGYVLGARDTAAFNARLAAEWYPKLEARVTDPGPDRQRWKGSDWARHLIHHPDLAFAAALAPYPSHGHIDLLPEARGRGIGRRAMAELEARLASAGSPGLHLQVDPRNRHAQHFYRAVGYEVLRDRSLLRHSVFVAKRLEYQLP